MPKTYECEYCRRVFRDTAKDRRAHRDSHAHQEARQAFEHQQLVSLAKRWGEDRLSATMDLNDLRQLQEIIAKPRSCAFHFSATGEACKYGQRCRNSHSFSPKAFTEQMRRYIHLLGDDDKIRRPPKDINSGITFQMESRRVLKKELFLNRWLEGYFGFDRQSDLIETMLHRM